MNVGEEICGEWLRHVRGCEFIQYNLKTTEVQGEIDVIGIDLSGRAVYACEVALHLVTGLQYVRDRRPDNIPRLTAKLTKDIEYIRGAFPDYHHNLMLWSPVVKDQKKGSKYNQIRDVREIIEAVEIACGITVTAVVNERFQEALDQLRDAARNETKELDSPVMRYLQVEERLKVHLQRLNRS